MHAKKNNDFEKLTRPMQNLLSQVQINIPFTMLYDDYLDRFLEYGLMLQNVYEDDPQDIRIILENLKIQNVGFCLDAVTFSHSDRAS